MHWGVPIRLMVTGTFPGSMPSPGAASLLLGPGSFSGPRWLSHTHAQINVLPVTEGDEDSAVLCGALLSGSLLYSVLSTLAFTGSYSSYRFVFSTQGDHWALSAVPSLCWGLETLTRQEAETIGGLTSFVSISGGITVLCCLVSVLWRPLFHVVNIKTGLLVVSGERVLLVSVAPFWPEV